MLLSIFVHLTMEPKQKEGRLDTKTGSDDVSVWTKRFVCFILILFSILLCTSGT